MTSPVICETQVAVRYAETDAMRIVHHSNYIIWFELGRVEYMKQIGSDYAAIEHSGHFFAVTEVGARYLSPARFGDTVKIRTWLDEVRSRTLVLRYEVRLEDSDQLLATGFTRHVCIDGAGQVTAIPEDVRDLLAGAMNPAQEE